MFNNIIVSVGRAIQVQFAHYPRSVHKAIKFQKQVPLQSSGGNVSECTYPPPTSTHIYNNYYNSFIAPSLNLKTQHTAKVLQFIQRVKRHMDSKEITKNNVSYHQPINLNIIIAGVIPFNMWNSPMKKFY
jgi:hypothetical protein